MLSWQRPRTKFYHWPLPKATFWWSYFSVSTCPVFHQQQNWINLRVTIPLIMEIETLQVRIKFSAVENLAVDLWLCPTYIAYCMKWISLMNRVVVGMHSAPPPILSIYWKLSRISSLPSHRAPTPEAEWHTMIPEPKHLALAAETKHPVLAVTFCNMGMAIKDMQKPRRTKQSASCIWNIRSLRKSTISDTDSQFLKPLQP